MPTPFINQTLTKSVLYNTLDQYVLVDFLMPNGIIIPHMTDTYLPLEEIKAEVWDKASEFPLYGHLHDRSSYHFVCLTSTTKYLELLDESLSLRRVNPFVTFVKVVERIGNEEEKRLNNEIGELIGKDLKDFDRLRNPEVNDFRWTIKNECDEIVRKRNKLPWSSQVLYQYPCHLAHSEELPEYVQAKMRDKQKIFIVVQHTYADSLKSTFFIEHNILPSELLLLYFAKKLKTSETDLDCQVVASEHVLKILGREEYLISEVPISQYVAIRHHISQDSIEHFQLIAVPKSSINVHVDETYQRIDMTAKPTRSSVSSFGQSKKKTSINSVSSWKVKEKFRVTIGVLNKVHLQSEESSEVFIEAGLYHAGNALCSTVCTNSVAVQDGSAKIDQELKFDIYVCNIPRGTRFCLAVYEQQIVNPKMKAKSSSANVEKTPRAWVNIAVYDYRGQLKGGSMTLYCWSIHEEQLGELAFPFPLGTVVSNPKHDTALSITITFCKYFNCATVIFPLQESIIGSISQCAESELIPNERDKEEIRQICDRPHSEFHEQEKTTLWSYKRYCLLNCPEILPKLLQIVEWDKKDMVAEMLLLLKDWPKLSPVLALELLDYAYAEPAVRSYAVGCLDVMTNDDLLLYLLQLVQALKHENYFYCDLVPFLLQRALNNRLIGHFFFWHLRSEMQVPSVSIRFGLILEAYCRGSIEHMKQLQCQVNALSKFSELQDIVRANKTSREKVLQALQDNLRLESTSSVLSDLLNPIDPTLRIHSLLVDHCKSMYSKMQPLWLIFKNGDTHSGKNIAFLYKKGDDIRQDMLTLQMITIIDKIWKDNGLDFRMNTYRCLSTNYKEGIIQIVSGAQTIANIQRAKGFLALTSSFRKESLLEWLKEQCNNEEELEKAINEFTLSCVGYSVATYVLGIADRHNDNIMILPNGQLFHIDYGHILGHFKEKFGIRRECQPFVLTWDFIHVIQKGCDTDRQLFENFKNWCEEAYMILRKYGPFIISLFAMMISTGLPELQSEKDLEYLKDALKLDFSEEEARRHFQSKIQETLSNVLRTSINWTIHNISKK